jgi:hypothetical protein
MGQSYKVSGRRDMQNAPFYMQEAPCDSLHSRCAAFKFSQTWLSFRFSFAYNAMFPGPESSKRVVIQCKACGENIPAPVELMPSQPIAAKCPLCHKHRRYLPSEVFLGRLSHLMIRKPVITADGRQGR